MGSPRFAGVKDIGYAIGVIAPVGFFFSSPIYKVKATVPADGRVQEDWSFHPKGQFCEGFGDVNPPIRWNGIVWWNSF